MKALGIRAFDTEFYMPPGSHAVMIEKVGTWPKPIKEKTLKEFFDRPDSRQQ